MSPIFAISTVIKQIEYLFEGWQSNEDDNFNSKGFLKKDYSDSEFSVQICLDTEFIVELDNKFFPQVELHISRERVAETILLSTKENFGCNSFFFTDVLNGWYFYDWLREKNVDSQVIELALDLTNKIRAALSIPSLTEFNEEPSDIWFMY